MRAAGDHDDTARIGSDDLLQESHCEQEVPDVADADGQLESVLRALELVGQVRQAGHKSGQGIFQFVVQQAEEAAPVVDLRPGKG